MAEYVWPAAGDRLHIGKHISRLDGPVKATGRAKYAYDVNRRGMLWAIMVQCPHAHARITAIDTSAAEAMDGVVRVHVIQDVGTEIQWAHDEIVAVAATSEEVARDGAAAVKIEYEVLSHFVNERAVDEAPDAQPAQAETTGDPAAAMASAPTKSSGSYHVAQIAHCSLESHGQVAEWQDEETVTLWASTQAISGVASQLGEQIGIPASNVHVETQYMGGGFGSKFSVDRWGVVCAQIARDTGRPVKLMLDRDQEVSVAGARPSTHAEVSTAADADGNVVAWDSKSWGSGGPAGANSPPLPYVFSFENQTQMHTSVPTNTGPARAWRAPRHPQACLVTMRALEDLSHAAGMDPLDFFLKNIEKTGERASTYVEELEKGAELMGWRDRWRPRGSATGTVRSGLGLALHTWGGRGHRSNCEVLAYRDGLVEARIGSQDLGTGTRTIIALVLAETFGVGLEQVKVTMGRSVLPASGASGGSTTVGGVSGATRRAALNAVDAVFERIAPRLGTEMANLELKNGQLHFKDGSTAAMPWRQAATLIGVNPVSATGANPGPGQLNDSGVGGIQMADVSVDMETGVVSINRLVAVQDCGLILDMKLAESQVYGSLIMGVTYALTEERVFDPHTGQMLNPDMEFYKLAGIEDVGEMIVHMMTGPGYDERGVIGLGEPPVIAPGAAIANAATNATGVPINEMPMTPERVLAAINGGMA
ncbi:MAG: xanthine dehydrogenase family protein molybdopterin-binding subunit [Acidobacteriota bacterium]|nr:xanthine dehydrogenase family protein molybdopterin-binding subunit [Acidobacteriota bacterium]MDE2712219.1 xanthine dehydrogenase family protein molybdopterin-binding subunit [Acidobacteriota bacterium]MXW70922.1 xanthine dehydrogenase family protein molybdopterin-binding subunit [Acidobacteriota bacterium]MXX86218.1 xanthine dehydrogenase family protein molybdopterin-binding subunit [Acidobacteriota bacterium]MYE44865.1 xanthine dehydrogenase family protein molybdopterin-binding subunit [A